MDIDGTIRSALQHYQLGDLEQAKYICMAILKERPDNAEVLYFLGVIYFQSGKTDVAIDYIMKSLQSGSINTDACHILGMAFQEKGLIDDAIAYYQKAIQLNPDYAEAYNNMGNAFKEKGLMDEAISSYKKAIQINPALAVVYRNIGMCLQEKGRLDEAIDYYQKAIQCEPASDAAYFQLGNILQKQTKLEEAIENYRISLQINPNCAATLYELGRTFVLQGKVNKGEEYYRHALQVEPDNLTIRKAILMTMNYNPRYDGQTIFFEHMRLGHKLSESHASFGFPYTNRPLPARRLKIGYVSPDFKMHSVAYFIEPVVILHDRKHYEVFCYSDVPCPDEVSRRIRGYCIQWRDISRMSDDQVAELIRSDRIDILVDLSGYTGDRMQLFARKPAPVQTSWLGYPATTGLSTMDYKIVDHYTDPLGMTEQFYTEKLMRLKDTFLCYMPDKDCPDVGNFPALISGHITFGSFNNFPKVSPEVFSLWACILKTIPNSCLIMKSGSFFDWKTRQYAMDMFAREGIETKRVELLSWVPSKRAHFAAYNSIDIGLDTFPYNGTTTTCEALWMGVPVISLAGNTPASRVGVSILSNIGLGELVAKTKEEYQAIAVKLAGDQKRLRSLHEGLRERMTQSPLTDAKRFIIDLEAAYRSMWEKWCGLAQEWNK
jgi:protein O-GlcNAc transferase